MRFEFLVAGAAGACVRRRAQAALDLGTRQKLRCGQAVSTSTETNLEPGHASEEKTRASCFGLVHASEEKTRASCFGFGHTSESRTRTNSQKINAGKQQEFRISENQGRNRMWQTGYCNRFAIDPQFVFRFYITFIHHNHSNCSIGIEKGSGNQLAAAG